MAALPVPAEGLVAVRLPDGSVLALGGDAAMGSRNRLAARFRLQTGAWERLPDAPVQLDTPAALVLSLRAVFIVAPSFAAGSVAAPSQALILDPVGKRWITLPSCPVPLLLPRLIQLDAHTVLAAGGAGALLGASFDLGTGRWTALAAPVARLAGYTVARIPAKGVMVMAAAAVDARGRALPVRRAFLLVGGHDWRELARPPVISDGTHAEALSPSRVLFAGGYPLGDDPRQPAPPALIYDAGTNRWTIAGQTGADHRGAQLVALGGGRAALVGGHRPDGWPSAGCLIFDGSRWRGIESLPGPWANYALVSLADGSLLLIGGDRPAGQNFGPVGDTLLLPLGTPEG